MLSSLLTPGARWTWVGGKGGVGKTTAAAALALELAERGRRVLAVSVDPAHSLGDALGVALGDDPAPVPGVAGLRGLEVSAERERERFLGSHRGSLVALLERGTYLDREDVAGVTELAVPGLDELAALFRLMELSADREEHVVVDTAPTGHTLRLLELPGLARGWLGALEAMEEKHRAVALALAGAYRSDDEPAALLRSLDAELARVEALLRDAEATRFLLVTTAEPVVLAETRRYEAELTARGIALAGIVVNRAAPGGGAAAAGPGMVFVPRLPTDPAGPAGLRDFAARARPAPPGPAPPDAQPPAPGLRVLGPFEPPADRELYLVGGKGGVGKSTAAAALAVRLAGPGRRVLLLSVDPAGSLGEVLGRPVGAEPAEVPGAPGLRAQQVDARAAWEGFRGRYRREAEQLFEGLLSGGLSADADRRVVERLIDLAPPGVDELMALLEVVDWAEDRAYDALVLDTAPTGHLLRLLELPGVALEWSHTLLRLLLKYREVVGLGGLAARVLELSRQLRGLRELLRDPARCWTLAVALPEALSVPETARLVERLRALEMQPAAVLVNRLLEADGAVRPGAAALAARLLAPDLPGAAAPRLDRGPVGPHELARFAGAWRTITTD